MRWAQVRCGFHTGGHRLQSLKDEGSESMGEGKGACACMERVCMGKGESVGDGEGACMWSSLMLVGKY